MNCDRNICATNDYNGIGCDECSCNKPTVLDKDPFVRVDDVIKILKAMSASGRSVNVNAHDFFAAVMELTEDKDLR